MDSKLPSNIHESDFGLGQFVWISIENNLLTLWDSIDNLPDTNFVGMLVLTDEQLMAIKALKYTTDLRRKLNVQD